MIHAFLLLWSLLPLASAEQYFNIRNVNFGKVLWEEFKKDCPDTVVEVDNIEIRDITGDGREDALVVAATCKAGPAGPDIHRAYTVTPDNELVELEIVRKSKWQEINFKNEVLGVYNFNFVYNDGYLIENYRDRSGRELALRIWYKWDGQRFNLAKAWRGRIYTASAAVNCQKATSGSDRAVCRVGELADLDKRLGERVTQYEASLPAGRRPKFKQEQSTWRAQRDKTCPLSDDFKECLTSFYVSRLDDINVKMAGGDANGRVPAANVEKKKEEAPVADIDPNKATTPEIGKDE